MTPLLVLLTILMLIATLVLRSLHARTREQLREYRIALDFLAENHADLPREFAAIFVAGNRPAMDQKFPGYFEFRAACIRQTKYAKDSA